MSNTKPRPGCTACGGTGTEVIRHTGEDQMEGWSLWTRCPCTDVPAEDMARSQQSLDEWEAEPEYAARKEIDP